MVGLIHKMLLDLVEAAAGADAVPEVKRKAGIDESKVFKLDEVYEDAEWQRLLAATCKTLNLSPEDAEAAFADHFFEDALGRWPMWFKMAKTGREFLERQPDIHNNFARSMELPEHRENIGAKFRVDKEDHELVTHYRSPNQLCGLYTALARRILDHYGDEASIEETSCIKNGDDECEIHIRWINS